MEPTVLAVELPVLARDPLAEAVHRLGRLAERPPVVGLVAVPVVPVAAAPPLCVVSAMLGGIRRIETAIHR